jgi:ankyrin repeat protein
MAMTVGMNQLSGICLAAVLSTVVVSAGEGDRRLVDAARARDREAVRALVKARADVNGPQADGATALHWTAHWDDLEMVKLLITARANVNAVDEYSVTPLSLACINGNGAIVEALLEAGADPNLARKTGETPLMTAARSGDVRSVTALLAHGAAVATKERLGQNALMWAAAEGHPSAARVLLEHGASVHERSHTGFTPLLFAARAGDLETVRVLLAAGADIDESVPRVGTALVLASASMVGTTTGMRMVVTPSGHESLAMFLLAAGANPNAADDAGRTALHYAVRNARHDLLKALLAHGANPNVRLTRVFPRINFGEIDEREFVLGATPLFMAAKAGDVATMRVLLAAGADPAIPANKNTTLLMAAASMHKREGSTLVTQTQALATVKLALELGGDVNAVNDLPQDDRSHLWTALHAAAYNGLNDIVQLLAEKGAALDPIDGQGRTPLSIVEGAMVTGQDTVHPDTALLLRKLGAHLGFKEMPGRPGKDVAP